MRIELIRAWPGRFETASVELGQGACVADALAASGWDVEAAGGGIAIFGVTATLQTRLHDRDRIELLRPLQADPKDARRRRAAAKTRPR